jgi:cytochrome c
MKNLFIFCTIVAATFAVRAEVMKLELPPETAVYKIAPGSDLAQAQCLTCHSADYVNMQPPMARAFWKGSVDKMIGKYGAPISTNLVDGLVDYLAKNYGTETNASSTVVTQVKPAENLDAKQLAEKWGCIACHVTQKIGPDYKEVAKKYKGNPEGHAKVIHQIENGGTGQWGGTVPMPPFTDLSMSEKKALADWVLSQ